MGDSNLICKIALRKYLIPQPRGRYGVHSPFIISILAHSPSSDLQEVRIYILERRQSSTLLIWEAGLYLEAWPFSSAFYVLLSRLEPPANVTIPTGMKAQIHHASLMGTSRTAVHQLQYVLRTNYACFWTIHTSSHAEAAPLQTGGV